MKLETVKVPKEIAPLFEKAQEYVSQYFSDLTSNPTKGVINIHGQRYILVRAASMSVHFLEFIKSMYPALDEDEAIQAASIVLNDMSHSIGMADAKKFHQDTGMKDPISKLSTGPIHFVYTGWAYVDIKEESKPSPDENYYLLYDHPQSFEADSWLELKKKVSFCTCFMNAGYSSGWCEQSFGIPLVAKEILCRAKGDEYCRFIMAQPHKIGEFITLYKEKNPDLFKNS